MCDIITDGALTMLKDKKGFVALLVKYLCSFGYQQDVEHFHCLVHQEALCTEFMTITEIVTIII